MYSEKDFKEKIAELLVVRASAHLHDHQREYPKWELSNKKLHRLLEEGVGGVILFGGSLAELSERCKNLNSWAKNSLLLCADVEEGVGQRFSGGQWLAPPMSLNKIYQKDSQAALNFAELYGRCIGLEARRNGLNWVLAPVCDVNTNSKNPVIDVRAWGDDPLIVSALTCSFYKGLSSQGVIACAKHFPGHGDTEIDSHLALPTLEHDLKRLMQVELVPFRALISLGIETVMTGHLLCKQIDHKNPATVSKLIISKLLRQELGFKGLVVTDALIMGAMTKAYGSTEAAVMAFDAGADLILMPDNPDQAIEAIYQSLLSGRIPMDRLENSLQRRRNLITKIDSFSKLPSTQPLALRTHDQKFRYQTNSLCHDLVVSSMEVLHPGSIQEVNSGLNLIRVDGVIPCSPLHRTSPSISLPEDIGYRTILIHAMGVSPWTEDSNAPLDIDRLGNGPVLLQLFLRGNPFRGDNDFKEPWSIILNQLQRLNRLAGLIVFGSPYIWKDLKSNLNPYIPAAYSPGQMDEAQYQLLTSLIAPCGDNIKLKSNLDKEFTI